LLEPIGLIVGFGVSLCDLVGLILEFDAASESSLDRIGLVLGLEVMFITSIGLSVGNASSYLNFNTTFFGYEKYCTATANLHSELTSNTVAGFPDLEL
jgi:hypothetical protein